MQNRARHLPGAPMFRIGIAEEADHRFAESGCKVHRPTIATDDGIAEGEGGDQVFKSFCGNGMEW